MGMKILQIACLGAAITLPQVALAELPLPNDLFGKMEASLDFCAKVNPQAAAKYQEPKKLLVRGASDKEVAEARASKDYKESFDSTMEELNKQPKDQAVKTCADALEKKN